MPTEGFHCCQCSTSKWLTFISGVEFSFLKINKHAAFEDFSFHFFKIEFNTATKCVQKFVEQDWILYSACPIVRRCTSDETIYKFYIRTTSTSSSKRYLINLAYLGVKLKKILAIIREAPSEIYVPKSFKPRIKKSLIALRSTFCIFSYIDVLHTISSVS